MGGKKKAKGEEVNIELIEDEKGNKIFRVKAPKADVRLDSAYMIVKNTTNADFKAICKLRECFVKKYGIDPYDLIRSLGNKKLENMKKEEIVKAIIKNLRDVNGKKFRKDDVQAIVNYFIDLTKQSLRNRDRVIIRSFGTFVVRHKNPKQINCVRTGEKTMTREKDHVAFIPSNDFDLDSIV